MTPYGPADAVRRDDLANDAAYQLVEREAMRSRGRFVIAPDPHGFGVIDTWTSEPATFANVQQMGISEDDAEDIREILNRRTTGRQTRRRQA